MTYLELRDYLDGMSPAELAQTVVVYTGDIDETIPVCGTSVNSVEDMGESFPDYSTKQVFLVLA